MGGLALEPGELFSLSRVPLIWIIYEAQKASLRFDQNKLIEYGFAEQESQFYHSFPSQLGASMIPCLH